MMKQNRLKRRYLTAAQQRYLETVQEIAFAEGYRDGKKEEAEKSLTIIRKDEAEKWMGDGI